MRRWIAPVAAYPRLAPQRAVASRATTKADLELAVLRTVSEAPGRRLRALILFGEHAREAITSEVALRVASALAGEVGGGDDSLRSRAAALRSRVDFALMPLVNVRGRRLFEGGDFCRRGNARNVDLNRNWRTPQWGGRETEHALPTATQDQRRSASPRAKL